MSTPTVLQATGWGEEAAARLVPTWMGRVVHAHPQGVVLAGPTKEVVRLVTAAVGLGPFHVVLEQGAGNWPNLPRGLYSWRVGHDLWLGDGLTVRLPRSSPWPSLLRWGREDAALPDDHLARHLALLADWLLARAPEATLASLLPDLLNRSATVAHAAGRSDLAVAARLFRWRSARVLERLLPALEAGAVVEAEGAAQELAGLGPGAPPAGDALVLGLLAGLQLWPRFGEEGSGLRSPALGQRLARAAAERSDALGRATLLSALDGRWPEPWHRLHAALTAAGPHADAPRDHLHTAAQSWLDSDEPTASAGLAGLLLPFLWHQRFLLDG